MSSLKTTPLFRHKVMKLQKFKEFEVAVFSHARSHIVSTYYAPKEYPTEDY